MTGIEITPDNFHQEAECAQQPVLLDFYAPWCGPCQSQARILDELCLESEAQWKLCKINIDENQYLTEKFRIMSVPTLMVMKQGAVVAKQVGVRNKGEILKMLES